MGARVAVVGVGVLVSLALMAAPSWAAGGNSANAKLCQAGGYPGDLLAQDGSAFTNDGKCTSYAARGGTIAGVDAFAEPAVGGEFTASFSGFGLRPGQQKALACRQYGGPSGEALCIVEPEPEVASAGTFSAVEPGAPCTSFGKKISALAVEAETAAGVFFIREFPPPTGC
jgi:hypothetical protein